MKIDKAIKRQRPIDFTLFNGKLVYTGICLAATKKLLAIVNFDFKKKKFDGYTIFKNEDFDTYSVWKKDHLKIKLDNSASFIEKYEVKDCKNFYDWFKILEGDKLVSFFSAQDFKSYYVGKILDVNKSEIQIHILNKKGKWGNSQTLKIEEIDFFSFDTSYENELLKKIKKREEEFSNF